ncbi:MAG: trypsin-like peptidase domain-containing protein [bacterium]|nr:trypsin-like peptidase domain-containing protein [bacterium]
MQRKEFLLLIAVSAISAVAAGFLFSASGVQANLFGDFLKKLVPNFPAAEAPRSPASEQAPAAEPYRSTVDYEERVVRAVESASPAVVSIVISKDVPINEQCPYNPFGDLPPEFRDFFGGNGSGFSRPCQKGTRRQEVGGGSGFIASADGQIVTNKHVVLDAKAEYTVFTNDGKKYSAKVLARDPILDIALVKIEASGLPTLPLGDSDSVKLGQTAIAIGNALGEFRNTVSVGVISGLSRTVTAGGGSFSETIRGVLQTDAAINPGNSGGPLLNLRGEVIGINTAVASNAQNIGFAIPINQAKRAIESVKREGRIVTPYLGVRYLIVNDEVAEKEKLSVKYGVLLRGSDEGAAVVKGSPAAKAGLRAEDVVLEINGERVDRDRDLSLLIQKYNVGDTVTLKVLRGKETLTLKATLEERKNL